MSDSDTIDSPLDVYRPGTSDLMLQIADRARRMYFLAQHGNWAYATHQLRKMIKKLDAVPKSKVKYAEAIQTFQAEVCGALYQGLHDKDLEAFEGAWT